MILLIAATVLMVDSVRTCIIDAATRAPIVGVELSIGARPVTSGGTRAPVRRLSGSCAWVDDGEYVARRVGYRAARVRLTPERVTSEVARDTSRPQLIELTPIAFGGELDTVQVRARADGRNSAVARVSASLTVNAARDRGANSTAQLIEQLPYVQSRSAHGETALSVRGARREGVAITLDGLPLNDPATGVGDVSDVPMAALGSATLTLGADALGSGPGASGGVLALTSAPQRTLAFTTGAFGQRAIEGAWAGNIGPTLVHVSTTQRAASNDFTFINTAGASDSDVRERRENNDASSRAASLGVIGDRWQLAAIASRAVRGMVGPANVHTYDEDRATTDRVLLRAQATTDRLQWLFGARRFALAYRDPTRPALDANATALASDIEVRGAAAVSARLPSLRWRVGGGGDQVNASGDIAQSRARGFASTDAMWTSGARRVALGARVDAITGAGVRPSFEIAVDQRLSTGWILSARLSQSVRAPTLYDLYFASPQRLFVKPLNVERILFDAEVGARIDRATPIGQFELSTSLVARDTRDAIVWFPGNFGWSPANVGIERLRGAEARARLMPSWGELSLWMTAYDAELTTGTLRIPTPYVPRLAGGAQWLVRHGRTSLALTSRMAGRRPFTAGPRNAAFELPGVVLLNSAFTHALPSRVLPSGIDARITWSLENATDVAWQSVRGYPSPGRSWAMAFTLRQTPQQ